MNIKTKFRNRIRISVEDLQNWLDDENLVKDFDAEDWFVISTKPKLLSLNLEFIRKYKDKLDWHAICEFEFFNGFTSNLFSDEFIREFKDYLDWYALSWNPNLSENIMLEFKDKLNLKSVVTRI